MKKYKRKAFNISEIVDSIFLKRKSFTRVTSCINACAICTGLQIKFGIEYPSYSRKVGKHSRSIHAAWYDSEHFRFHYDGLSKRMKIWFEE